MTEQLQNIQVLFRVRPLIQKEADFSWNVMDQSNEICLLPSIQQKNNIPSFQFTKIYDENQKNADIFETAIQPLVSRLIDGFNCTVLAYGQSSSGKTSTMFKGPNNEAGLVSLIVDELFKLTDNTPMRVKLQYIEIYNEKMIDLLSAARKEPMIREENGQMTLLNVEEPRITQQIELLKYIREGNSRRTVSETNLNEQSSRSHAIIRLVLEQGDVLNLPTKKGFKTTKQSCFTLVDLAGSERIEKTRAQGANLKEANNINKSLLTLGLVINQLAQKSSFVNYRDSKLTRLLQSSLGGSAITFVIGCISPAAQHIEESVSTMRFCERAMKIQTKAAAVKLNCQQTDKQKMEQLIIQNRNLKQRIADLERQFSVSQSQCIQMSSFTTDDGQLNLNELSQFLDGDRTAQSFNNINLNSCSVSQIAHEKTLDLQKQAEMMISSQHTEQLDKQVQNTIQVSKSRVQLEQQRIELRETLEQLKQSYEELKKNNAELQVIYNEQALQNEAQESENAFLKEQLQQIDSENEQLQNKMNQIEQQTTQRNEEQINEYRQQLELLSQNQSQLANERDQLLEKQQNHQSQIASLQEEVKQQQQLMSVKQQEYDHQVNEIKAQSISQDCQKLEKFEQSQKQLQNEIQQYQSQIQQLTQQIQQHNKEKQSIIQQLEITVKQFNEQKAQVEVQTELITQYTQQMMQKDILLSNCNQTIDTQSDELLKLRNQLELLNNQVVQQEQLNIQLIEQVKLKQGQIDVVTLQQQQLIAEQQQKEQILLEQTQEYYNLTKQQIEQNNKLNDDLKKNTKQQEQLTTEKQQLQAQVDDLNVQLEIKKTFINSLEIIIKQKETTLLDKSQQCSLVNSPAVSIKQDETMLAMPLTLVTCFKKSFATSPMQVDLLNKSQLTSPLHSQYQKEVQTFYQCSEKSQNVTKIEYESKSCQNSQISIQSNCRNDSAFENDSSILLDESENKEAEVVNFVSQQLKESIQSTSVKASPLQKVQFYQSSDSETGQVFTDAKAVSETHYQNNDETVANPMYFQKLMGSPLKCSQLTVKQLMSQPCDVSSLKTASLQQIDISLKNNNEQRVTNSNSKVLSSNSGSRGEQTLCQSKLATFTNKNVQNSNHSIERRDQSMQLEQMINNDHEVQTSQINDKLDKSIQNTQQSVQQSDLEVQTSFQQDRSLQCDQKMQIDTLQQCSMIVQNDKSIQFEDKPKESFCQITSPYQMEKSIQFLSPIRKEKEQQCVQQTSEIVCQTSPYITFEKQINTETVVQDDKSVQLQEEKINDLSNPNLKEILTEISIHLKKLSSSTDTPQTTQKPKLLKNKQQDNINTNTFNYFDKEQLNSLTSSLNQVIEQQFLQQQQQINLDEQESIAIAEYNIKLEAKDVEIAQLKQQLLYQKQQEQLNMVNLLTEIQNYQQYTDNLTQQLQHSQQSVNTMSMSINKLKLQLNESEELNSSLQQSYFENEMEMTQKILEITQKHIQGDEEIVNDSKKPKSKAKSKKQQQEDLINEYKTLYEQSEAKFNKLLAQSKETIQKLISVAKERETNLQKKAAEEIRGMVRYKEMVMKMQQRAKLQQQMVVKQQEKANTNEIASVDFAQQ